MHGGSDFGYWFTVDIKKHKLFSINLIKNAKDIRALAVTNSEQFLFIIDTDCVLKQIKISLVLCVPEKVKDKYIKIQGYSKANSSQNLPSSIEKKPYPNVLTDRVPMDNNTSFESNPKEKTKSTKTQNP